MNRFRPVSWADPAGWVLLPLLLLIFVLYVPGLSGDFLLDDYVNLDQLGEFGGVDSWHTLAEYLFAGRSAAAGRPVALASFLINDIDWPSSPYSFKYTNVLLHMLLTSIVAAFALQLARALEFSRQRQQWIAILAAAVWGLHPFFVSTVLYIVQRMAMLSTLFIFCGLTLYVIGRRRLARDQPRSGYILVSIAIAVFTPLAFLSKQNGALLPVLALVLEFTVLAGLGIGSTPRRYFAIWRSAFLYLPILLIVAYFVATWHDTITLGYLRQGQGLTLKTRLLTEPRILFDYIAHLVIPRMQTSGLFHDQYQQSTSLLSPVTTLPSIVGILAGAVLAICYRQRYPIICAGALFFLAGHLVESTIVPLELYFEHRNYMPTLVLAFAAGVGLTGMRPRYAVAASLAVIVILASLTYGRATLWGQPNLLALTWAQEAPSSLRGKQYSAILYFKNGLPQRAQKSLESAISQHPQNGILRIQYLAALCANGQFRPEAAEQALDVLRQEQLSLYHLRNLENLASWSRKGCEGFGSAEFGEFLRQLLEAPGVERPPGFVEDLGYLRGHALLHLGDPERAFQSFRSAAAATRSLPATMQMAAVLASAGEYGYALAMLDRAEQYLDDDAPDPGTDLASLRRSLAGTAIDYESEITRMRERIQARQRQTETGNEAPPSQR